MDERTAPAAWRLAEGLQGRLMTLPDAPVHLLAILALHGAQSNRAAEAEELAQRALACEPYPPPLDVSTLLIHTLRMIERPDLLQTLCEDLLATARRRGAIRETIGILVSRATASYEFGGLADAEADARWALEHADGRRRLHALSELIQVLVERDVLEEAGKLVSQFPDPRSSRSIDVPRVLIARGRLRAAEGRLEEAVDDFVECGRRCTRLGLRGFSTPWRAEAAVVCGTLGDAEQARRLAGEQLELARGFGRPRMLGISLRACGLVESGQKGLLFLGDAVRTLESSQSPLELARALSDNGAALRRAGSRVQARAELERALDLAYRLGARRIANRARSELIAAGAKPRRDAIAGRDALTDAEWRVARLAADGLTNREIAQALFITTTTAKSHLGRVYRKLDIAGRDELKQALSGPLNGNWPWAERRRAEHFLIPRAAKDHPGAVDDGRRAGGARLAAMQVPNADPVGRPVRSDSRETFHDDGHRVRALARPIRRVHGHARAETVVAAVEADPRASRAARKGVTPVTQAAVSRKCSRGPQKEVPEDD